MLSRQSPDFLAKSLVKFIYSEKATKVWEISTLDLSNVVMVKSTVEILHNFVAFSEYKNFNSNHIYKIQAYRSQI